MRPGVGLSSHMNLFPDPPRSVSPLSTIDLFTRTRHGLGLEFPVIPAGWLGGGLELATSPRQTKKLHGDA